MFDHKNNNQNFGSGNINLLPEESRQEKENEVKPKKSEPLAVHEPAKEKFSRPATPKLATSKSTSVAQPKRSLFSKIKDLFGSPKSKTLPPVVAVSSGSSVTSPPKSASSPTPRVSAAAKSMPAAGRDVPPASANKNDLEVNLLPATKKRLTDSQIIFSYFFIFIICLLVVFTPYIYFKGKNKGYINNNEILKNQLSLIDSRIKDMQGRILDYGQFSLQLRNLNNLFNFHVYWSLFFPTLEQHTVGNVYFTSLSLSEDRKAGLEGAGLNLRSLAEQLVVMGQSKIYTNFKLQSLNFVEAKEPGGPTINFGVSFTVPESVIASTATDTKSSTPAP
ncbi:hypothetical protein GYA13_03755 [Candidatus Kuenenbacteria bacterium]|nr:hypothetical protein [Candidatus Kuenenbacteria bacterium]